MNQKFLNHREMKKSFMPVSIRLSLMMFFQYLLFAVWWVPLGAYLINMEITGARNALILSSMAIGCIASPIIGMIADRHYASEKLLIVMNVINAVLLIFAGLTNNSFWLFIVLLIAMLCYMPTWSLTSSIAMTHSTEEQFPRIRVFGSIGWVASGIFSLVAVRFLGFEFDGTNLPFYCGAGVSLVTILVNFTLPKTPPPAKGQKSSVIDALGLRTVRLMKDKNFAVFIVLSFLFMVPFAIYWSYCSEFLLNRGFEYITITMNWGQLAEILIMVSMPFVMKKIGLKNTMILGLVALLIRYISFYMGVQNDTNWLYFVGILMNSLVFSYFLVGGQIYINRKAPPELRAQAQGFILLVTIGVGLLVGNFISRNIIDRFSEKSGSIVNYNWESIWMISSAISLSILMAFILFFKEKKSVLATSEV